MTHRILVILAIATFTMSCGKSTEDLNEIQKSTLKEFTASMSRLEASGKSNGVETGTYAPNIGSRISFSKTELTSDEKKEKMTDLLKTSIKEGRCKITSSSNSLGSQIEFSGPSNAFNFTDPKKDCPIYGEIALKVLTVNDSTFVINFQALSQEFKELSDIDFIDLAFKISSNKSRIAQPNEKFNTKIEGNGTIRSQTFGSVGLSFKNTAEVTILDEKNKEKFHTTGTAVLRMEFKDFATELATEYIASATATTAKYKLNGKDMTEAEINEYFSGMNPI